MPDLTMCKGIGCRKKNTCYRFTAVPNEYRQSYFTSSPMDKKTKKCDHYYKKRTIADNVKAGVYSDWSRKAAG